MVFEFSYHSSPSYYWVVGVLLACLASLISNIGLNLQKLLHIKNAHKTDEEKKQYYKHSLWWLGLGLVIAGSVADFAALFFAPQAVIAPLGSLTLVSNTVFAPILLKEKIGLRDIIGTGMIVIGAAVAVSFGPHQDVIYDTTDLFRFFIRPFFIIYTVMVAIYMCVLIFMIRKMEGLEKSDREGEYLKWRPFHQFAYASLSGCVGACSVLYCKCIVELMSNTSAGDSMFQYYQSYLIIAAMFLCIFSQIYYLNSGLRRFDSAFMVPVFQSFWIVFSVASGLVFFKEYHEMSWMEIGFFGLGVLVTIVGVLILSKRAIEHTPVSSSGQNTPTSKGSRSNVHVHHDDREPLLESSTNISKLA